MPNLATGELFNVGVGFIPDKKTKVAPQIHTKLLTSAKSFRCMYGNTGVENFTFLLTILADFFRNSTELKSPSPHIIFGEKSFARGHSPQEIVERTFTSMVSLRLHHDEQIEDRSPDSISNIEARDAVWGELYHLNTPLASSIIKKQKTIITSHSGHAMSIDIPLRQERRFGTIASAYYRQDVYISNNLNCAMRDMMIAKDHAQADEIGGIFILRAPTDERYFTESWQRRIDDEIARLRESLFNTKIHIREGSSIREVANEVIAWTKPSQATLSH